ncbi:MAG: hypothetical protein R6U44_00795 [Archaeoglobaceae archaeon]
MRLVDRREFLKWMGIISSFAFSGCIGREKVEEGLRPMLQITGGTDELINEYFPDSTLKTA